jgi:hypothetical protein
MLTNCNLEVTAMLRAENVVEKKKGASLHP